MPPNFNGHSMGVPMGGAGGYNRGGMPGGHFNPPMMGGQGAGMPHGTMMRPPIQTPMRAGMIRPGECHGE